jgi:hypothetical protein
MAVLRTKGLSTKVTEDEYAMFERVAEGHCRGCPPGDDATHLPNRCCPARSIEEIDLRWHPRRTPVQESRRRHHTANGRSLTFIQHVRALTRCRLYS